MLTENEPRKLPPIIIRRSGKNTFFSGKKPFTAIMIKAIYDDTGTKQSPDAIQKMYVAYSAAKTINLPDIGDNYPNWLMAKVKKITLPVARSFTKNVEKAKADAGAPEPKICHWYDKVFLVAGLAAGAFILAQLAPIIKTMIPAKRAE